MAQGGGLLLQPAGLREGIGANADPNQGNADADRQIRVAVDVNSLNAAEGDDDAGSCQEHPAIPAHGSAHGNSTSRAPVREGRLKLGLLQARRMLSVWALREVRKRALGASKPE